MAELYAEDGNIDQALILSQAYNLAPSIPLALLWDKLHKKVIENVPIS